jgi:hypothetical protein
MSPPSPGILHSRRLFRGLALAAVALAATTLVASVNAHPPSPYLPYGVSLEDEGGNVLRSFRRDGTTFVLGYVGERYNVRLTNHTDRRVEAVLSVDGRDAVSGDRGDFVHQRGYLVAPHGSVVVNGFRQSLERAAAFRFSHPASSYSARMGTPENVGVIGVAFFSERITRRSATPPYVPYEYDSRRPDTWGGGSGRGSPAPRAQQAPEARSSRDAAPAPAKRRANGYDDVDRESSPSRLGTEYGESTYSPVSEVPFQRQNPSRPDAVASVRYDDADGLVARGFDVYARPWWSERRPLDAPDPFPESHFAAPPP